MPHTFKTKLANDKTLKVSLVLYLCAPLLLILGAAFVQTMLWTGPWNEFFQAGPIALWCGVTVLLAIPLFFLTAVLDSRYTFASSFAILCFAGGIPGWWFAGFCGGSPGIYCTESGDFAIVLILISGLALAAILLGIAVATIAIIVRAAGKTDRPVT